MQEYLKSIVYALIISEILVIFLQDNVFKKYLRIIVSLALMLIILQPLIGYLFGQRDFTVKIPNAEQKSYLEENNINMYQQYLAEIMERNGFNGE